MKSLEVCAWCIDPARRKGPAGLAFCRSCYQKAASIYRVGVADGRAEALPVVRAARGFLEAIDSEATASDGSAAGELVASLATWAKDLDTDDPPDHATADPSVAVVCSWGTL